MRFIEFRYLTLLALGAAALTGCATVRHANFPGYDTETVFNATVSGACAQKGLIVYEADKAKGIVNSQTRGVFGGAEVTMTVSGSSLNISAGGGNNPWPDRIIRMVQDKMSQKPAPTPKGAKPAPAKDVELERQKLELEKERLKLDRERLELEKMKLQQQQQQQTPKAPQQQVPQQPPAPSEPSPQEDSE